MIDTNLNFKFFLKKITKGNKKIVIDWQLKDKELILLNKVIGDAIAFFHDSSVSKISTLKTNYSIHKLKIDNIYDVYHPTGTIRMGVSSEDSVIDSNLKLHGCSNLFVSSTAIFPTPGSANPGLTHLALTNKLALFLTTKGKT